MTEEFGYRFDSFSRKELTQIMRELMLLAGVALFAGAFYVIRKASGPSRDLDSQRDLRSVRRVANSKDYWDDIKPK